MKRFLHVIMPLLLVALIIFSVGWYLLEYDPDFTRDILLAQARYLDQVGNRSAAVWFYDLAYLQSDNNDDVALELAQQYASAGNYTKAEYTLSHAIADGASIELYIALCETFVAQNKLLDAVTMLNNIADPTVKAQLEAIRPEAPAPSHAPGTYSQYIHLSFTAAGGSCYVSADKTYPSLKNHAYTAPFMLSGGETVFYGVTVGDNGLVSPLGIYSYVISGVIEEVHFKSEDLEQALRTQLGFGDDRPLYSNELWSITEFEMPAAVTDYTDLKWLPNLEKLVIQSGSFTTLKDIAHLTKLKVLSVTDSVVPAEDVKYIAALPNLSELTLNGCQLSTIADLSSAKHLTYLDLRNNTIRDISALSGMKDLKSLYIDHNAITSLEAIAELTALENLTASYNALASTSPLSGLYNLVTLDISRNGLMDLTGIEKLTGLKFFYASNNNLTSIDAISGCKALETLDVSYNTLLNLDVLSGMLKLQELNFAHNEISALPEFSKDSALWSINGEYNQIASLEALSGLHHLAYIDMDYNQAIRAVDCLETCHHLVELSIFGTNVSNVQVLKDMNVKVYYDPT